MNNSKIADLLTISQILNWVKDQIINDKILFDDTIKSNYIKLEYNDLYRYRSSVYINNKGQSILKYTKECLTDSKIIAPTVKIDNEFNSIINNQYKSISELKLYLNIIFNDEPNLNICINTHVNVIDTKIKKQFFLFKNFEFAHILSNTLFSFDINHGNYRNTITACDNDILLYNEVYNLYSKKKEEYNNQQHLVNVDNSALLLLKRLGFSK